MYRHWRCWYAASNVCARISTVDHNADSLTLARYLCNDSARIECVVEDDAKIQNQQDADVILRVSAGC